MSVCGLLIVGELGPGQGRMDAAESAAKCCGSAAPPEGLALGFCSGRQRLVAAGVVFICCLDRMQVFAGILKH
jgi:hypothetical protein